MTKEQVQKIIDISIEQHTRAKIHWTYLYRSYFTKESAARMKRGVNNIVSIIEDLVLKPSLTTSDESQLDEILKLSKEVGFVYNKNKKNIKEAMRDGVITNHGTIYVCPNYNDKKIIILRKDPYKIAKYTTADGQLFVIDFIELKVWTEEKLYSIDENYKIVEEEVNYLGFIPYAFYTPHRIEFGGSQNRPAHESTYGQGEYELKAIQDNLDHISEMMSFASQMQLDPPKLYSGNINDSDLDQLSLPGGRVQVQNIDMVKAFTLPTEQAMNALINLKNQSLGEMRDRTSQTELTMGAGTSTSASGALIQQHKESMLSVLKDFEDAYFEMFENFSIIIAYYLSQKSIINDTINWDEIEVQKYNKDLNASESLAFLQNFGSILGMIPNGKPKIEIMSIVLGSVFKKYASLNTDQPEQVMRAFDKAMENAGTQAELQEQQQAELLKNQQNPNKGE